MYGLSKKKTKNFLILFKIAAIFFKNINLNYFRHSIFNNKNY